jgi:hypothetical protein
MVYGGLMSKDQDQDNYDEQEAQERFEAALRAGLKTPPTPLKEKPKVREGTTTKKGSEGAKT